MVGLEVADALLPVAVGRAAEDDTVVAGSGEGDACCRDEEVADAVVLAELGVAEVVVAEAVPEAVAAGVAVVVGDGLTVAGDTARVSSIAGSADG